MATFASDADNPLSPLVSSAHSLTLDFLVDPTKTKMFDGIDADLYTKEAMTYNSHHWGLSMDTFSTDAGLKKMFTPTSTSTDPESGDTFVASMESENYPFFGT